MQIIERLWIQSFNTYDNPLLNSESEDYEELNGPMPSQSTRVNYITQSYLTNSTSFQSQGIENIRRRELDINATNPGLFIEGMLNFLLENDIVHHINAKLIKVFLYISIEIQKISK